LIGMLSGTGSFSVYGFVDDLANGIADRGGIALEDFPLDVPSETDLEEHMAGGSKVQIGRRLRVVGSQR
jgi:hypothetical protein